MRRNTGLSGMEHTVEKMFYKHSGSDFMIKSWRQREHDAMLYNYAQEFALFFDKIVVVGMKKGERCGKICNGVIATYYRPCWFQ